MYLHVGNGKNIRTKHIIGIFDTDNATVSPITRAFLRGSEKKGMVSSAIAEIPKSFVLNEGQLGRYAEVESLSHLASDVSCGGLESL